MKDHVVSESIAVSAPPEAVFAILADPQQHPRIDGSGTLQGNVKGPERLSKGAEFGLDMKMAGLPYKIRNRVVEFEEDRRIAWRHFAGHRWRYVLDRDATGTRVTESFDYSTQPRPVQLLLELTGFPERNRRGIVATLRRLKDAAERDAS